MKIFHKTSAQKPINNIKNMARIEALWGKTRAAEQRGDLDRAIAIQKQLVLIDESSYASVSRLASLYYLQGNYSEALECYQQVWAISDDRNWPLQGMRDCYRALGDSGAVRLMEQRLHEWEHAVADQRAAG
jgi:tetratricopeptide (TPR) repeat protein